MGGEVQIDGRFCLSVIDDGRGKPFIVGLPQGRLRVDYEIRLATVRERAAGIDTNFIAVRRDEKSPYEEWG